jgi:hypothetical protein
MYEVPFAEARNTLPRRCIVPVDNSVRVLSFIAPIVDQPKNNTFQLTINVGYIGDTTSDE